MLACFLGGGVGAEAHEHVERVVHARRLGQESRPVEGRSDRLGLAQHNPRLAQHGEAQHAAAARGLREVSEVLVHFPGL